MGKRKREKGEEGKVKKVKKASLQRKKESEEDKEYRKKHHIYISEPNYKVITSFSKYKRYLHPDILQVCKNFDQPTPIQATSISILMDGRDMIGVSKTGSGKTYAFMIPSIGLLPSLKGLSSPKICIISPTRELAMQTYRLCLPFESSLGLQTLCICGGVPSQPQIDALYAGVHIIVATPGRLKDLIEQGHCDLSALSSLILDEGDRLLDLGFEKDIEYILSVCPSSRQTIMFSATWPKSVERMAGKYLKNPVHVRVGEVKDQVGLYGDGPIANKDIHQEVLVMEPREKNGRILALLKPIVKRKAKILLFVLYRKEVDRVHDFLQRNRFSVVSIHGGQAQEQRSKAMEEFREGKYSILIATDVAARGLDIPGIETVFNYTFPLTIEEYVHRIGRCGRGGKKGKSITFFTQHEKHLAGALKNVLRDTQHPIPDALEQMGGTVKKKKHDMYGDTYRSSSTTMNTTSKRTVF